MGDKGAADGANAGSSGPLRPAALLPRAAAGRRPLPAVAAWAAWPPERARRSRLEAPRMLARPLGDTCGTCVASSSALAVCARPSPPTPSRSVVTAAARRRRAAAARVMTPITLGTVLVAEVVVEVTAAAGNPVRAMPWRRAAARVTGPVGKSAEATRAGVAAAASDCPRLRAPWPEAAPVVMVRGASASAVAACPGTRPLVTRRRKALGAVVEKRPVDRCGPVGGGEGAGRWTCFLPLPAMVGTRGGLSASMNRCRRSLGRRRLEVLLAQCGRRQAPSMRSSSRWRPRTMPLLVECVGRRSAAGQAAWQTAACAGALPNDGLLLTGSFDRQ